MRIWPGKHRHARSRYHPVVPVVEPVQGVGQVPPTDSVAPVAERGGPWLRRGLFAAVIAALLYFAWRAVWRALTDSGDLAVGFSAARAWLVGHDPYDAVVLKHDLLLAGGTQSAIDRLDALRNVYFPPTLPLFLPVSVFSWPLAAIGWLILNVGAVVFVAVGLARLFGWSPSSTRALALTAFLLALAPVHTTIASGQTGLVATAALVAAMLLERSGRPIQAGLAYGLATAIKVQVGLPFLAYLVWRRRWGTVKSAAVVLAGLSLVSVGWMEVAGRPWYSSWISNLATLSGPGGINDPGQLNPDRYSLVNLQYLLDSWSRAGPWPDALAFVAVALAGGALLWLVRGRRPRNELLALAAVAVLGLLVTYHRYYDAVLLALPIAWAIAAIGTRRWGEGVAAIIVCADFMFPIQTALHQWQQDGLVPAWLTGSSLWDRVLLTQQVWALVLLVVVLLSAAWRERDQAMIAPDSRIAG